MARAGESPDLAPRRVEIRSLDLLEWDDRDPARPIAVVDVACSAGTYVRALARDLGERLGTGAYLGALTRTGERPVRDGRRPIAGHHPRTRGGAGPGRDPRAPPPGGRGPRGHPGRRADDG